MSNEKDSNPPEATRLHGAPPTQMRPQQPAAAPAAQPDQGATLFRPSAQSVEPAQAPDQGATLFRAPTPDPVPPPIPVAMPPAGEATIVQYTGTSPPTIMAGAGPDRTFETGSVIRDRFVLEALLGRGGMGIVFAALDRRKEEARDPNPHIAIKILNADFRNHPDSLMALQREARKAQTLAHPNVVTVFDFDRDGTSVYMTMEKLRGRSLDSIVREARGRGIGREAALPIIRGIAEGLAYAHRKGIVHSDLKPGNVFVLDDGTPKILDFGIARAVPSAAAAEKDVFDAGSLGAYTEAYATAEMVEGVDPHPSDDVYALGLIAYELLTGLHATQRMSAPDARKKGIKIPAPKLLKMREWRALEGALSFERVNRPVDAADFLKKFFGVTKLQKSLLAAVVVLALTAGFFGYRTYEEAGPAVPFNQLPAEIQTQFTEAMSGGDQEWAFYQTSQNLFALQNAIGQYAEAYRLHPRNRQAVSALERSADAFLAAAKDDRAKQVELADALAKTSDYLSKYKPVTELLSGR
jgi:hypothetical protein